jgi:hypothetical protein
MHEKKKPHLYKEQKFERYGICHGEQFELTHIGKWGSHLQT